jgi:hypothetical protein
MERHDVLELLAELKLYGIRSAYDEIIATGVKRQHPVHQIVGDLLKAEIAETETDPLGNGWVSIKGTEVGDACDSASVALDQDLFGNSWDLTLGGEHYLTQYLLERTSRTCKI